MGLSYNTVFTLKQKGLDTMSNPFLIPIKIQNKLPISTFCLKTNRLFIENKV